MIGLLTKLIVSPIIVILSSFIFPDVSYASYFQAIVVGLVLAIVGHVMEVMFLRRGRLFMSTLLDFAVATLLLYLSQYFLPGSRVLFLGAFFTALLLSLAEHLQHIWLINSGRAEKA